MTCAHFFLLMNKAVEITPGVTGKRVPMHHAQQSVIAWNRDDVQCSPDTKR